MQSQPWKMDLKTGLLASFMAHRPSIQLMEIRAINVTEVIAKSLDTLLAFGLIYLTVHEPARLFKPTWVQCQGQELVSLSRCS